MSSNFNYILIFFLCFSLGSAQDTIPDNPRIGLVLSGGGAKGLAHIGVLKTIDSLGLRLDYIGGTSMGAVVGGLYAYGYSAQQLDSIFRQIDFDVLLGDKVPRPSKTFQERKNAEKYAVSLPVRNFKIQLPSSISRGQNVYNLLTKLTIGAQNIEFKNLPIPFYCMATNMETGQRVTLDRGNLAQALSISSALPTLFQPIEHDGYLLMDGGIVDNYPIEILKSKPLDYIIGVNVQEELLSSDEIKSVPDILTQINNFRTVESMQKKADLTDFYLKPEVKGFSIISFNKGSTIIDRGQASTTPFVNQLSSISKQQKVQQRHPKITPADTLKINQIHISGNDKYTSAYILGKLRFRQGETVSFEQFNNGVNNLLSTNNFDSFRYEFSENSQGRYDLFGQLKESETTSFLKLGVHYDKVLKSALLLNFTKKQFLLKNDVLSMDFIFGDNSRFNFDYYIDKGYYWSIGLNSNYKRFKYDISPMFFEQTLPSNLEERMGTTISDFTTSFFVETLIKKDFSFKIGTALKRLKIHVQNPSLASVFQSDKYQIEDSQFFSLNASMKFDTLDDVFFPTSGFLFEGHADLYLAGNNYDDFSQFSILKANMAKAFSVSDNFSILLGTEGGFRVGYGKVSSLDFGLGGYAFNHTNNTRTFYGYDFFSLSGDSFVKAYFLADYEIYKRHHINLSGNFANIGDDIFLTKEWLSLASYSGMAFGYGLETIFGPIEVKYHWSLDNKYGEFLVNLGYWF